MTTNNNNNNGAVTIKFCEDGGSFGNPENMNNNTTDKYFSYNITKFKHDTKYNFEINIADSVEDSNFTKMINFINDNNYNNTIEALLTRIQNKYKRMINWNDIPEETALTWYNNEIDLLTEHVQPKKEKESDTNEND